MYFLVFLRLSAKSSKNLEKTKKKQKKQTHGMEKIWGVGVCFFVFFVFFWFSWGFPPKVAKTSRKPKKQKTQKNQTHGMEKIWGVGVCVFFWFWKTLADIVRRKGADGVRLSVSVWLQFGIECTKCVKMMVFTHCQGRPFCFFLFFCFFISKQKRLVSSRQSPP